MAHHRRMSRLLDALAHTAAQRGEAVAISDERQALTWRQLFADVHSRAETLGARGLEPGDRVAIVAENSVEYLSTVLAVWHADAVPVTIYPSTTTSDLASTLRDADPVLVLGETMTADLVRDAAGERFPWSLIDPSDGIFASAPVSVSAAPTPESIRDDLALICYSSGTTTRPKAIMLSADAIENAARTFSDVWRLSASDVTLVCLPMAWLFGLTTSTLATLWAGGTVVSRRRSRPAQLAASVQAEKVTVFPAVTTVLTRLARWLDETGAEGDLGSLRLIVSGGEARNEQSFAALRRHTGIPVHDNYCASEMQPLATYDPIADPEPRPGSGGRLVPRSELRIIDADGRDVAPGDVGEGLSRGPGLMLGYWNDPEATAAALTADGWYRTRDLLRIDDDGYIHVVGRASDMIIRGGSNVSPGEIEARLLEHGDVVDAVAVGVPDPLYGEEVVAVIVLREGASFDAAVLQAFAGERLAAYKVPTRLITTTQLPASPTTGKVNRRTVKQLVESGESS